MKYYLVTLFTDRCSGRNRSVIRISGTEPIFTGKGSNMISPHRLQKLPASFYDLICLIPHHVSASAFIFLSFGPIECKYTAVMKDRLSGLPIQLFDPEPDPVFSVCKYRIGKAV